MAFDIDTEANDGHNELLEIDTIAHLNDHFTHGIALLVDIGTFQPLFDLFLGRPTGSLISEDHRARKLLRHCVCVEIGVSGKRQGSPQLMHDDDDETIIATGGQ